MSTLRDMFEPMILLILLCSLVGSHQNLHHPLPLLYCWDVLSVEIVRDEIQLTPDKNPQNCKNSFCLGSFLTTKSRRYDDYKDSLSEIPFSTPCCSVAAGFCHVFWSWVSHSARHPTPANGLARVFLEASSNGRHGR